MTHPAVTLPQIASTGAAVTVQVVALDAQNHPVPNYTGAVSITSTDTKATLPTTITFQKGQASLQVTWATTGPQSLTVKDTANASLTGTAMTTVT